ncbi:MAG: sterol desaturase family protein [Leptospirales bacterium]|nr:sterol desaturase family protein [Leptospirales bacterium]
MMQVLLQIYTEPRFFQIVFGTVLVALASFLIMATPLTILAILDPPALRRYRIQPRRGNWRKMLPDSLEQLAINVALTLLGSILLWPLLRLSGIHSGPWPAWYVVIASVAAFAILDDFLFYCLHFAMHRSRWLYRKIHSVHHRFPTPIALSGNYMHPLEYMLISLLVTIGPALIGAHVGVFWIWVVFRQWEAAEQHSGYDFPFNPMRLLPLYDGARYHDFHHSKFFGNYSGLLSWTDTVFGTRAPRYDEYLSTRRSAAAEVEDPFAGGKGDVA